jgi:hypothetical protein
MYWPMRIEFPGAAYHVTAGSGHREAIFVDDAGRAALLESDAALQIWPGAL